MSDTTSLEIKQTCLSSLRWGFKNFREDMEALPEEAFDKVFGGKARTIADFVYEVILVNDHIRLKIAREELFAWPEGDWIHAPANLKSKEAILGAFNTSADQFLATLEGFTEEQMLETIPDEEGKTTNRFAECRFVSWHTGYHSGQLNFIQTLLGDDRWHWT